MNLKVGSLPHGPRNAITDVSGVLVGHCTVDRDDCHTGVTVVLPPPENPFRDKLTAASFVWNGFGKSQGLVQIDELGTLETPIALTNTLNVGKVHDALVSVMAALCEREKVSMTSVNPVVLECNDSRISDIVKRPVGENEVWQAIATASADFAQGDVGAGRGTICYGMKGGIGSSSRLIELGGEMFTLGVLVQSNYGSAADFNREECRAVLPEGWTAEHAAFGNAKVAASDQGSIIMVIATDLPLSHRQLQRVIKRASVGMARLGSYVGHGSGEIMVGFTTEKRVESGVFMTQRILREDDMNLPFRAVGEACEEAILQSMLNAKAAVTRDGETIPSLAEVLQEK